MKKEGGDGDKGEGGKGKDANFFKDKEKDKVQKEDAKAKAKEERTKSCNECLLRCGGQIRTYSRDGVIWPVSCCNN